MNLDETGRYIFLCAQHADVHDGAEAGLPKFLTSATDKGTWSALHLRHFITGKSPRCPLNRMLGRIQSRF